MLAFLGDEGMDYLREHDKNGKLVLAWGSVLYGNVGMQVRNYLHNTFPDILDDFKDYGEYEDFSWELIKEVIR